MEHTILSWITFVPLIGMAVVICLPKQATDMIKGVSLVATGIPLILATWAFFNYGGAAVNDDGYAFTQRYEWIPGIKAFYYVGADGISLPLIWLTTLLLFIGVPASFGIKKSQKAYYALLLLLEVGILGVFVSLDYFVFYVFWEIMLRPMYFLIGIWGGPRREYAAIKFFL